MKKDDRAKKPKASKTQELFKTFLSKSKEHDKEMTEQKMAREKEMQAAKHTLIHQFMGSLTQLLKKD